MRRASKIGLPSLHSHSGAGGQKKGELRGERRGGGAAPGKQEGKMMRRLFLEAADRKDGGMREEEVEVEKALWLIRR